jgi:Ca2+-binding EF-hand superfamily protein
MTASKKPPLRLNSSQIGDLFRRLDVNGDGTLDITEFFMVAQRLLGIDLNGDEKTDDEDVAPDTESAHSIDLRERLKSVPSAIFQTSGSKNKLMSTRNWSNKLSRIFEKADKDREGTLSLNEFVKAYNMIFDGNLEAKFEKEHRHACSFVTAIRYGIGDNGIYIHEEYTGTTARLLYKRSLDLTDNDDSASPHHSTLPIQMSLGQIMTLVHEDAKENAEMKKAGKRRNIMWWIDIAQSMVAPLQLIHTFGLPHEILNLFYTSVLGSEIKSRVRIGRDQEDHNHKKVETMSVFIQTAWLKNRPVVDPVPDILTPIMDDLVVGPLINYLFDRFSLFFSFASFGDPEREESLSRADVMAKALSANHHAEELNIFDGEKETFLLCASDMKKRTTALNLDTLSMHFISYPEHGSTPNCLLTVRKMDKEEDIISNKLMSNPFKWGKVNPVESGVSAMMDKEQFSLANRGVLGRILHGMRSAIGEVIHKKGVCSMGDLCDSVGALSTHIICELNSFSFGTPMLIEDWINLLEEDIEDMAVTKHNYHLRKLWDILQALEHSVLPLFHFFEDLGTANEANGWKGLSEVHVHMFGSSIDTINTELVGEEPQILHNPDEMLDNHTEGKQVWMRKIEYLRSRLGVLREEYSIKLDEKRNSWSFTLTLVTIATWPITALTGYWGMNFDNMPELDGEYVLPMFPGYHLMWFVTALIYGALIVASLHMRVFYAAS